MRGELGKNGRKAKEGEKGKERDLRKMEGGEKPGAKAPGRTATKGRPLPTGGWGVGVKRPTCLPLSCLSSVPLADAVLTCAALHHLSILPGSPPSLKLKPDLVVTSFINASPRSWLGG